MTLKVVSNKYIGTATYTNCMLHSSNIIYLSSFNRQRTISWHFDVCNWPTNKWYQIEYLGVTIMHTHTSIRILAHLWNFVREFMMMLKMFTTHNVIAYIRWEITNLIVIEHEIHFNLLLCCFSIHPHRCYLFSYSIYIIYTWIHFFASIANCIFFFRIKMQIHSPMLMIESIHLIWFVSQ